MIGYRMVIAPAEGKPPIARFWFESRRTHTPWWAVPIQGWWTRWRRSSPVEVMARRDGDTGGTVVPFADERDMRLMQQYLTEIG